MAKERDANAELRARLNGKASKPVVLYKEDGSVHSEYEGIRAMAKANKCCSKTINKAISEGRVFKKIGKIEYKKERSIV